MDELGYLNDRKYAEDWLQVRLRRHPEGRWPLLAGLRRQGVQRETAEDVLSRLLDEETELEAARRAVEKLTRSRAVPRERAAARLSSLGFAPSVVRRVLDQLSG
jgi:regulatory protein